MKKPEPTAFTIQSPSVSGTLPRVSVITAVYNARIYLNDCIISILSQSYPNFEYIIIDGGSSDGTVDIIKQYQDQLSYWITEPDRGIYDAWNKGLAVATGEWIAFVGADDLLHPDALQTYVAHINQHPRREELEFISSRIELVHNDLSPIIVVGVPWEWKLFKVNMITWHVGCFHARRLFDKYGVYNPTYKICGDYELLMRPKDQLVASFVDKSTVRMRIGGVSSTRLHQAIRETYRAKVDHKIISLFYGKVLQLKDSLRVVVRNTLGWKKSYI